MFVEWVGFGSGNGLSSALGRIITEPMVKHQLVT